MLFVLKQEKIFATIRKNKRIIAEIKIIFKIEADPIALIISLGRSEMICVIITITTKNDASTKFNLSLVKFYFLHSLIMFNS